MPELQEQFSAHTESREYWLRFFFFYGNRLNNPSSLITRESLAEIGSHNLFYIQAMDFEWWVRFTKKFSFGILEEPLVYYRRVSDPKVNVSSCSEEHDTRFYNEYMCIRHRFLMIWMTICLSAHSKIFSCIRIQKALRNFSVKRLSCCADRFSGLPGPPPRAFSAGETYGR